MLSGASSRFEGKLPTVHQISGIKITDNDALCILTIEYGTSTLFQFLFSDRKEVMSYGFNTA